MNVKNSEWQWAGALSIGTSHSKANQPRQDHAAAREYYDADGAVFAAVVSDGAGSTLYGGIGSRVAVTESMRLVRNYFQDGGRSSGVDRLIAEDWVRQLHRSLQERASQLSVEIAQLACTLTLVLVGKHSSVVIQVGDSVCVAAKDGKWIAPIWPMKGQYANETFFLSKMPFPTWEIAISDQAIDKIAVFSDGIERQVLSERDREVFQPFFEQLFTLFPSSLNKGRDRLFSKQIQEYLDGESITDVTDDDKALIVARRLSE